MSQHNEGQQLFQDVKQLVSAMLVGADNFAWCRVESYDDVTHTAQVRVEPDGLTYPSVPVLVPFRGVKMPHAAGMQGCCLTLRGEPQVLLGVTYTTRDAHPPKGMMLEESLLVVGDVTIAGGLYLGVSLELPPPLPQYKYALTIVSERPADSPTPRPARTYQLLPSADGSLHWVQVAAAP